MSKMAAAALTALFITATPLAYAQAPSGGPRLTAADVDRLTDARVDIAKAALQLAPDQEKYWPAVEEAIRNRAKDRQARVAADVARSNELGNRSRIEVIRDRDPVAFLHRRADALAQRSADLKKLADAWQPVYQTLN